MKINLLRISLAFLMVLVGLFSFSHAAPVAEAQTLSPGCTILNTPFLDSLQIGWVVGSMQYYANEQVVLTASAPVVGVPTLVSIEVPTGTTVASTAFPGTVTYTFASDQVTTMILRVDGTNFATLDISCGLAPVVSVEEVEGITDGRLCYLWDDFAVYTTGEVIDVYGIWEQEGFFVLRVTQEELDAAPGAEGVNTLIKSSSDGEVQVYRLGTTNTLQVHAGLDFVRFTGLPASGVVCGTIQLS
jgi:hypothetical protein